MLKTAAVFVLEACGSLIISFITRDKSPNTQVNTSLPATCYLFSPNTRQHQSKAAFVCSFCPCFVCPDAQKAVYLIDSMHTSYYPPYRRALPLSAVQEVVCSRHAPAWRWNHLIHPASEDQGPPAASNADGKELCELH